MTKMCLSFLYLEEHTVYYENRNSKDSITLRITDGTRNSL